MADHKNDAAEREALQDEWRRLRAEADDLQRVTDTLRAHPEPRALHEHHERLQRHLEAERAFQEALEAFHARCGPVYRLDVE